MVRTCNNCDINRCPGALNAVKGCEKRRRQVSKAPMRSLISKVTFDQTPNSEAILPLLLKYT